MSKLYAVVPAAGIGARMLADRPKQYLSILGKTVLEHTLDQLLAFPEFKKIIVVISKEDAYFSGLNFSNHSKVEICQGGQERYDSVLNGLIHLKKQGVEDDALVMVHDVARPCIKQADLFNLFHSDSRSGAILGLQVRDTMKRTDESGNIIKTVERNNLWHALTPQMANLEILYTAISTSLADGMNITDEASALEYIGLSPKMVAGDPCNIKITRPDDLALAQAYLEKNLADNEK